MHSTISPETIKNEAKRLITYNSFKRRFNTPIGNGSQIYSEVKPIIGNGNQLTSQISSFSLIAPESYAPCSLDCSITAMVQQRLACLEVLGIDADSINQVVDVGCGRLECTVELLKAFRNAQVAAFEPEPGLYAYAVWRHKTLRCPKSVKKSRLSIHNIALCSHQGQIPLYVTSPDKGKYDVHKSISVSMLTQKGFADPFYEERCYNTETEIVVNATTLDNWCAANAMEGIDILWLDTPGAIYHVLQGAEKTLKTTKLILIADKLEPYYIDRRIKVDMHTYLIDRGFVSIDCGYTNPNTNEPVYVGYYNTALSF